NLIAVFVLAVLVVLVVLLRRRYPLQVNGTHLGLNGDSGYVFLLEIENLLRLRGALLAGRQLALVEPDEGAEAEDGHQQDEQRTGAHDGYLLRRKNTAVPSATARIGSAAASR